MIPIKFFTRRIDRYTPTTEVRPVSSVGAASRVGSKNVGPQFLPPEENQKGPVHEKLLGEPDWDVPYRAHRSLWQSQHERDLSRGPVKILVGDDGTEASVQAIDTAVTLGRHYHSQLTVVRVVAQPATENEQDIYKSQILKLCEPQAPAVLYLPDRPQTRIVAHTDAAWALSESAIQEVSHLIVVGRNNIAKGKNPFLGSTTRELLKLAQCPVLISLKRDKIFLPKKILVPVDGTSFSYKSVIQAMIMGQDFGAEILLVHVTGSENEVVKEEEQLGTLMDQMQWKNLSHQLMVESGDAVETIISLAQSEDADLIVMGTHRKHHTPQWGHESVALELAMSSPCPILILHPEE